MKKFYFRIALRVILLIFVIEITSVLLASGYELPKAIFWYYAGAFASMMVAGTVFFKLRALWEIERQDISGDIYYKGFPNPPKPLTSYLLKTSWIIILLFTVSFLLSFFGFLDLIGIPREFHYLFRWPAFGSLVVQAILTIGGWLMRDMEAEEIMSRLAE